MELLLLAQTLRGCHPVLGDGEPLIPNPVYGERSRDAEKLTPLFVRSLRSLTAEVRYDLNRVVVATLDPERGGVRH